MPRVKTAEKRRAVLDAATRVIAEQGLGAPTATIAREAGLSNGSLFNYFPTKAELFNELYLDLKRELAAAVIGAVPAEGTFRERTFRAWSCWTAWGASAPAKQRALTALDASPEVSAQSRAEAHAAMEGVDELFEEARQDGPLREQPLEFVVGLVAAVAATTMEFMARDPDQGERHCRAGFAAVWRALT